MEVSMSTLEERIATALTDKISSADVEALIIETEAPITAADAAAEAERTKALDPVGSPDPIKARAAMEGAAFTRDRLLAALPRLRARLKEAEVAEQLARWRPEYERVKAVRDALAAEMREVYPAAVETLTDLFLRMEACDRQSSHVNGLAPPGVPRLRKVELTARGVEGLLQPDVWIAEMLRLPFFWRDKGPIYVWPPPTPPAFVSFVVPSGPGPNWLEESKARAAAQRKDSERAIAFYESQRREREEREFKEGREAMAREVAERNRRNGWPC
jgi:hypothetical protein